MMMMMMMMMVVVVVVMMMVIKFMLMSLTNIHIARVLTRIPQELQENQHGNLDFQEHVWGIA
jgi:hypothetical protein